MSSSFFVHDVQGAARRGRLGAFAAMLALVLAVSSLGAAGSLEASPSISAAAPAAVFSITPTAQSTLWLDANKCNAQGPRGAWLSFIVTNTSGVTQTGVTITFAGFTGANATYFKATQDPLRTVGALDAGQSTVAYFYVDYAEVCLHPHSGGSTYDGYTANYTVTAASSGASEVYSGTVTTDELLTANASGVVTSSVLGPGAYVGQILTQAVTYSFGVNDDLFFQPAIEANFNDACWRLVDSAITATTGQVTGVTVPQGNRLWFPDASTKSGDTITVTYYWESLCSAVAQTVTPWAAAKSGQKYKYSGASGASLIPAASAAPVTASKTGPACVDESNKALPVTYTVVFSNNWSGGAIILKSITDQLPACMRIVSSYTASSDVKAANSSSIPSAGAQGAVSWAGKYLGAASGTTYKIPAAGTLTLQFTVDISSCAFGTSEPGYGKYYSNIATGLIGNTTISMPATTVRLPCSPLAVDLASFTATAAADGVTLAWETVSETDNAGFNVYRADSDAGPWTQLNAALIPAATPGSAQGNAYTWTDGTPAAGTTWYLLEDVSLDGIATQHEPVSVTVTEPNAVHMTAFGAATGYDNGSAGLTESAGLAELAGLIGLALAALAGVGLRKRR